MKKEKFYWLNEDSRTFLSRGYLEEGERAEDRYWNISKRAEELLGKKGFADKFYDYLGKGFYSLSTPVICNFGKKSGLPVSCYGSYVPDDTDKIFYKSSEIGMMSKMGGGTSGFFGDLRPRGSEISTGGTSNGPISFFEMVEDYAKSGLQDYLSNKGSVPQVFELFDGVAETISQGCYDEETQVLTNKGWKFFREVRDDKNLKIAQVNNDESVSFVEKLAYFEYDVKEDLIWFKDSRNIDLLVTKNHNMVYKQEKKKISYDPISKKNKYSREVKDNFYSKSAENCPLHRDVKYLHSAYLKEGDRLSNWERILIATQADGNIVRNCKNAVRYRFSKKRKSDRIKYLLDSLNIEYSFNFYERDNTYNYYVNFGEVLPKKLDWVNIENVSYDWCVDFLNEILEWDGSKIEGDGGNYYSVFQENVDKVQEICSVAGYKSYISSDPRLGDPTKSEIFKIYFSKGNYFGVEKIKKQSVFYEGKVYCVEVPSNKLIVRRGGRTVVCGNSARRGSFAAYLPVDHPDIMEFLQIREEGHPIQRMSIAVTISDEWMNSMISGDKKKREIWARILRKRYETGYPYVTFIDNINNNAPLAYKDKGLKIKAQNLCAEVCLFSDPDNSFVCVLSSLNLLHWDEIKNTDAIETLTYFLESVNEEFVLKTKSMPWMSSAHNFAKNHRALGLGVLGWHSYLQSKMISFESFQAKMENSSIWEAISSRCNHATEEMAKEYGETDLLKGYGKRNVTTMAVAPTTSSSFILGQISPSIEPLNSNYFVKKLAKGNFTYKNPFLKELLSEKGKDDSDTWRSVLERGGSVQHLDFLSQQEKDVFKTFGELSQKEIIIQAAQRQKYIDQGQSLNIMVGPKVPAKEVSDLMIEAWRLGVKSLYYQRGANPSQELARSLNTCTSCEG